MRYNQLHTTAARSDLERRPLRSGLSWELLTQQPSHCEAFRIVQFKKCDHRAASRMRRRMRKRQEQIPDELRVDRTPTLGDRQSRARTIQRLTRLVGGGGPNHSAFR